jgi:ribonuclease VapC
VIVDTSALMAIMLGEPDASTHLRAILAAPAARLSAASYLETGIVADSSRNPADGRRLDSLLRESRITIEPVTAAQALIARQAYRDFGKGSGHPAALNFGDCFSYALAKDTGEPLLYSGNDFGHTDVRSALADGS